ncbi:NAD(P)H-binding protein [Amycolatopsis suaedae]|uniref:Hydroxylase n=1 Tax=Amycolatopsis suaedae TaxID=2510978 RepID=A0A4Q7JA22_9PSEU|nr:NAD(P)H-binding protein [Amycolatopsis suaedae]RZQ63806.1 hydroxylase [Amycolatopsis suaedae]
MTYLVTGATGNVGRLVVDHLRAAGAPVRALTKNPRRAALPDDVEVAEGYLGDLATLPAALDGVERMYLAPLPETVADVVALARKAGVRRIVALSQSDADSEAALDESQWHYYAVEHAVENSGAEWTFLRPGQFYTNALDWAAPIRSAGVVRGAYPDAAYTPIDLDDIAATAAATLLADGHHGQRYHLTGPQTLTKRDQVRIVGEVLGIPARFEEVSREQAYREMSEAGWGEAAGWMLDLDARVTAEPERVLPTVERITGRPPRTFADWVAANRDRFNA